MNEVDRIEIARLVADAVAADHASRDQTLREMIQHEDRLRDDRLSYLLTLNGFLFAALAFGWKIQDRGDELVVLLAAVGFVVGLSARAGQITSNAAVRLLKNQNTEADPPLVGLTGDEKGKDEESGKWKDGHVYWWNQWLVPWKILPWLLIVVWAAVVAVRLDWISLGR